MSEVNMVQQKNTQEPPQQLQQGWSFYCCLYYYHYTFALVKYTEGSTASRFAPATET